jgi:hypothetical protein
MCNPSSASLYFSLPLLQKIFSPPMIGFIERNFKPAPPSGIFLWTLRPESYLLER